MGLSAVDAQMGAAESIERGGDMAAGGAGA